MDCPVVDGDGYCTHTENASTTPADCAAVNGDGFCTHTENASTTPDDCAAVDGDGSCTHTENASSTPADCAAVDGDGFCTHTENASTTPNDCAAVDGDGSCTHTENASTTPDDCAAVDGFCTHTEDASTTPADCGSCSVAADYGAVALTNPVVRWNSLPTSSIAQGNLNADTLLELYDGFGVFAGGIAPGTYALSGDDLQYATCGLCVRVIDSDGSSHMATGGSVTIASVEPLVISWANTTFEHVDIDGSTSVSTPHADGCTTALTSASIDLTPSATCDMDTNYGAATLTSQAVGTNNLPSSYSAHGALNADADWAVFQLFSGYGVFAGGIATGSYTLAGVDLQFSTCGLCVYTQDQNGEVYMATGGQVTITSVDPLVATLSGAPFQHVSIDGATYESTPHNDGCTSAVTSASIDVTPICTNTCAWPGDGVCDDGGPGATYADCDFGTDCTDCGPR